MNLTLSVRSFERLQVACHASQRASAGEEVDKTVSSLGRQERLAQLGRTWR
jgi:hypothetical protein